MEVNVDLICVNSDSCTSLDSIFSGVSLKSNQYKVISLMEVVSI